VEIGESIVASYLRQVRGCELILSNVHLKCVQGELDVVGLERAAPQRVWLCEVTTHILGMNNPVKKSAAQRVDEKVVRAIKFARDVFPNAEPHFEVWSPIIRPGLVADLEAVARGFADQEIDLAIVANEKYTERLQALVDMARCNPAATGDDAFRMLQIVTRVKGGLRLGKSPASSSSPRKPNAAIS